MNFCPENMIILCLKRSLLSFVDSENEEQTNFPNCVPIEQLFYAHWREMSIQSDFLSCQRIQVVRLIIDKQMNLKTKLEYFNNEGY